MSAERSEPTPRVRARREPPPLRPVTVVGRVEVSPRLLRLTFEGAGLTELVAPEPAASVRLLVPSPGAGELVMPEWNGNEFLLGDGQRPTIRTFTPRRVDPEALELDLDVVLHEGGAVSDWVGRAVPGDPAAVSGPGRGYTVDSAAASFLLAGDQTAIPAICQLVEAIPIETPVEVIIEIVQPDARLGLPDHPRLRQEWLEPAPGEPPGSALVMAMTAATVAAGTKVWVAGEAAAMHRIRTGLFDARGMNRTDVTVRGYWKHGR